MQGQVDASFFFKKAGRNLPEIGLKSRDKNLYQNYLHRIANFCATVLKIYLLKKNKSLLSTTNVENMFSTSYETRQKMMKF